MNLPNWITLSRILLIPFFIAMALKYKETQSVCYLYYAILIFAVASVTDALDGAIARIRHQKTKLGAILDPLADKCLLLSAVLLLSYGIDNLAKLPLWIPITFITRDVIIVAGTGIIYMHNQKVDVKPNMFGKITTFAQMLLVIWILLKIPYPFLIWRAAGALTIISGVSYLYAGNRQLADI